MTIIGVPSSAASSTGIKFAFFLLLFFIFVTFLALNSN